MKTPALVGTPITPLRWPLGLRALWGAGMGSPDPDQTFRGRQWALTMSGFGKKSYPTGSLFN